MTTPQSHANIPLSRQPSGTTTPNKQVREPAGATKMTTNSTWTTTASNQWSSRPQDERFTSLTEMHTHFTKIKTESVETIASSRRVHLLPAPDNRGLSLVGPNGHQYTPTHWSFGQLAALAEAPAGYLRTLPSPIAADNLNYSLQFKRKPEDIGFLLQRNGSQTLRAATGPNYGRIWNQDCLQAITDYFGDGTTSTWTVPGEFGKKVPITKDNTTLFASDRDFFIFLADEQNRITIPNRRNNQPSSLARGFFVWNSEVGSTTFGLATFLFDYACSNRIIWGGTNYNQIKIRHTASAPDKFIDQAEPILATYRQASPKPIEDQIKAAQEAKLPTKLDDFLAKRFTKSQVKGIILAHNLEENHPIETLWDTTTAVTAYAKTIPYQDQRITLERQAGEILNLAQT